MKKKKIFSQQSVNSNVTMTSESVDDIFAKIKSTLLKKNEDYGSASFDLGMVGNVVHIHDKESRLRTLVEKYISESGVPNFESIEDTLCDMIGYCVIGLHILKNEIK